MKFNRSLWPKTMAARIVLLLLVGLGLSHVISLSVYNFDREEIVNLIGRAQLTERITTITGIIKNAPPEEREKIISFANSSTFQLEWGTTSTVKNNDPLVAKRFSAALSELTSFDSRMPILAETVSGEDSIWRHLSGKSTEKHISITDHFEHIVNEIRTGALIRVSIEIGDNSWLNYQAPDVEATMPWSIRFVLSIAVMMIATAIFSAWAAHYLTDPLKKLSIAAEDLGRSVTARPIPEKGPLEVIQSVRVFNKMQARIYRFVEDRTQMIAAIAHDLRTPLMRMQLRSELLDDNELKRKFSEDIDEMNQIVTATLSFASEDAGRKKNDRFDIVKLISDVVVDLSTLGFSISWVPPDPISLEGQKDLLRRALSNLIENAAKYGEWASIHIQIADGKLIITIDDDGPGIAPENIKDVFKPFFRLEGSRSRETGGTGLGLSIARSAFRSHGGDVTIRNRAEGGLRVEAYLPF
ncbi:ATP-binding protein [Sneathiella sp.]|uniref:ATP-binding protein n=1 Tax=Sneathiella sp. TaxID=1964365 RepID=UPI00263187FB|nr:ATP-binding protein [Sneathiella sp.]MDF2366060.1 ATP-binding protein [Sneathiella sp.]